MIGPAVLVIYLVMSACGIVGNTTVSTTPTSASPASSTATERGTAIGQIAPEFKLAGLDGSEISSNDIAGKPAVLVFWTAWCPRCKEEAPHINQLVAEFESKGVKVVGINIGEGEARVKEGIKDFGSQYPIVRDADTSVSRTFKVVGTPTIVFLDKKGSVQYFGNELPKDYADRLNTIIGS